MSFQPDVDEEDACPYCGSHEEDVHATWCDALTSVETSFEEKIEGLKGLIEGLNGLIDDLTERVEHLEKKRSQREG